MIVRVDTTNLARGQVFKISVAASELNNVSLYFFNTSTKESFELEHTVQSSDSTHTIFSKSPYFDGFLLGKINGKCLVVKKIGYVTPHFVIGYKAGYTIPFVLRHEDGSVYKHGDLKNIIDGFYYVETGYDVYVMETMKKRFLIKEHNQMLPFEYELQNGSIDTVLPESVELSSELGSATLADISLQSVELNATLPTTNITG